LSTITYVNGEIPTSAICTASTPANTKDAVNQPKDHQNVVEISVDKVKKQKISVKDRMTLVLHQKQQQTSTTSEMFQQQPSPSYVSQFHHRNQTFIQAFSLSLKQKPYHNI
jgi:hypothetical protein